MTRLLLSQRFALVGMQLTLTVLPFAASAQELTLWTQHPEMRPFYNAVLNSYNAKHSTQVTLNILATNPPDLQRKVVAALTTRSGPDIFEASTLLVAPFVTSGVMKPNPPNVDAYVRKEFPVSQQQAYLYPTGSYGLPRSQDPVVYFYNKRMFKEAGLDPEKTPGTFDELMDYARKLTKYNADGTIAVSGLSLRIAGQGTGVAEKFRFVLYNMGSDFIVPAGEGKWRSGFNDDRGRAALKFYIDALYKYKVDSINAQHDTEAFLTERTAMFMREANVILNIQAKNPGLDYGTFPITRTADRKETFTSGRTLGIYVTPTSKQTELAWNFILEANSAKNVVMQAEMTGWIPVRTGVDYSAFIAKTPQWRAFVAPPADVKPFDWPNTAAYQELLNRLSEMQAKAFRDSTLVDNPQGIAATIQQMSAMTDQILKDNGVYGP